ncbi:hypothetical protein CPT_Mater238 [Bacillus phage Mater]|uniref:Uncharacterized protein n=1 Tax=Bacillus phage Mater TaxID=1540090 RepID=A0A0A0RMV1_9CAUD|nr:hypothetical protein CPT_Mater16 [Bacillus phage Mater]YP_009151197.1 hypothetical protein CPT_Mater238 [Bacillus phage Mater]AIW03173.1 hypothetical protein CPT_Mater16 [Bacillus phage Mater]AIW03395.1 hypothetical protein CPT_Mater238 [Bacillus phage Mater]
MTNTNNVQNLINEVMATRGATVSVFGQPQEMPATVEKGLVDIIDILEGFAGYEVETVLPAQYEVTYSDELEEFIIVDNSNEDTSIIIEDGFTNEMEAEERMYELQDENAAAASVSDYLYQLDDLGYIEEKDSNNSYNWLGNVSNHFNYRTYASNIDENFYVEFAAHLYGDVRANYTDSVLLKFDNDYTFLERIGECDIIEEYKGYNIQASALSEGYEIDIDGSYVDTQYSWEDAIEYIDQLAAEEA